MTEQQTEKAERVRDERREDGIPDKYPLSCYNIRNLCEEDNCECGKVMEKVKYAEERLDYGNSKTIGEILDVPGLGSAIMATRVYLKRYIRGLMN